MKILVIGGGGREHAIAWKVAQNPKVEKVFVAPGNGGSAIENKCENINLTEVSDLIKFAKENSVYLTIVGPEDPLTRGFVDEFKKNGLRIFGPSKAAAELEGSKIVAKNFMKKYGVKTAEYAVFEDVDSAKEYAQTCQYPVVIKADGLAAGKGVVICQEKSEAISTLEDFMVNDIFAGSGKRVVFEEFLEGVEASILSITDGETVRSFISAKDHKQIFDENKGPNTGGMGVIAPNPYCTEEVLKAFEENIVKQTLQGIKEENLDYTGIIFFGIMINSRGVFLLEYNVRFGDPETQVVLSLMESDLVELVDAALDKKLKDYEISWKSGHGACVVAASGGYPGPFKKNLPVTIGDMGDSKVFAAGMIEKDGVLYTAGGRVLAVVSTGDTLEGAIATAYKDIKNLNFEDIYYRKDIGTLY